MSQRGIVKYSYLALLSQPAADRPIYRELRQHPVRRIVEIGIGSAVRAQRMIELLASLQPDRDLCYTGVDLFEARPAEQAGISLKTAHTLLRPLPAQIKLLPGPPGEALQRWANELIGTDLLLVAADQDPQSMARAWPFVPRMLHEQSRVMCERTTSGSARFERLDRAEIDLLSSPRRRGRDVA